MRRTHAGTRAISQSPYCNNPLTAQNLLQDSLICCLVGEEGLVARSDRRKSYLMLYITLHYNGIEKVWVFGITQSSLGSTLGSLRLS